jgi:hypothetical protein
LQEIYNGYKQKNPKAIDIIICPDNYKAPRIFNLPESFDTFTFAVLNIATKYKCIFEK